MADRAAVFGAVQIAPEATPGTMVTPTKKLQSMSFTLTPDPAINVFRPNGYLFATVGATNYEETKFSMTGQAVYDELPYLYSGVLINGTITTPGGGTLSRTHTYTLSSTSANTTKTYTVESGDTDRGLRAGYMQFAEGGWSIDLQKGMQLSGGGFAQKLQDLKYWYLKILGSPTTGTFTVAVTAGGSTQTTAGLARTITASALQTALEGLSNVGAGNVTATGGPAGTSDIAVKWQGTFATADSPTVALADTFDVGDAVAYYVSPSATALPLIPITGSQIDVYTASAQSGLAGATALSRAFNLDFKVGNRFNTIKPLNTSNGGTYAGTVEAVPSATFKFSVGADSTGMTFLSKLRANTKVWVRVKATGPVIEGSITYSFIQDMCLILNKPSEVKSGDDLLQIDFEGAISHDATAGYALSASIVNTLTAL